MAKESMYDSKAEYYDLIYHWKDYKQEAKEITKIISTLKKSKGNELLDIACGSGSHLTHLKNDFKCTGTDLNGGLLVIAKKKNPSILFVKQDMKKLKFNKKFDVIVCLFSSIGHLKNETETKNTIKLFSEHLQKGGVLIIEPWIEKKDFKANSIYMHTYENPEIKLCRMSHSTIQKDISKINMNWMVAKKTGITSFNETLELLLMPKDKLLQFTKDAGLRSQFIKTKTFDRGLLVGVKS